MDKSYSHVGLIVPIVMGAFLLITGCYCVCKKIRRANIARRNIVTPEPAIAMQPPTYEEALQIANALARKRRRRRRRNLTHNDVTSDNANNDTQPDEATGDSNTGDSSNDNENSDARNIQNDSGITSNLVENSDVILGRDQKDDDANAADDSGVKSGSGDDTIDGTSIHSIHHDTANCNSAGGGNPRAPSPWVDFK